MNPGRMNPGHFSDMTALAPGLADPVHDSQAVFRAVLDAFARPGRIQTVRCSARLPVAQAAPAALNILLALLDQDCTLWLAPVLRQEAVIANLRFHTGCRIVEDAAQAQFVWAASGAELPALSALACGSEYEPEFGATCLVQVEALMEKPRAAPSFLIPLGGPDANAAGLGALSNTPGWMLHGPGIADTQALQVEGLPANFAAQWAENHARFPRGIDLLLCAGEQIAGLPRTTRIES
ncbi:MAG: phosphonate C-P lyase system protein PhnH [Pseudomonadota bacterium]